MRLLFLGTASAEGYPATFCNCENCLAARERRGRNIRARASLLVDNDLLIDFSPDVYRRSVDFGVELRDVGTLLVTHSHEDHLYIDELRLRSFPFAVEKPRRMRVICSSYVARLLRKRYRGYFRELNLNTKVVRPFETIRAGRYVVTALAARHAPEHGEQALIYLVEKGGKTILYACDTGPLPPRTVEVLSDRRLDAVVSEATLGILGSEVFEYHMGFRDVIKLREWMVDHGVITSDTPFVVTHFSHLTCPLHEEMEESLKPYGITPAYDGLSINI